MLIATTQEERNHQKHLSELREELIAAVASNDHPRIEAALLTGAAKIVEPTRGITALMEFAAFWKQASVESVRLLLAGSDPLAQDDFGLTPLMFAINSGRSDLAAMLLPLSDANARDDEGATALMHAPAASATEIVPALIAASDPKAVDHSGWNALMCAAAAGKPECVELLLPVSDPKACGARRETALSLAIRTSQAECADRLAEFSEHKQAERAFKRFGARKMRRWAARREAEALLETIGAVDRAAPDGNAAAPAARAKAIRI